MDLFNKISKLLALIFTCTLFLYGQVGNGRISGYIKDSKNGEPLMFANIVIEGTDIGTASDNFGYYVIPKAITGNHTIKFMMMGYESYTVDIQIAPKQELRIDVELKPTIIEGEDVTVTAERQRFKEKVEVSRVNLGLREIKSAPAFVEADLFRTIQLLPGVTSTNDFSSALVVRGGNTDENLILLDGIELYNPYHLGGVFSTFNASAISDAEFISGGFPANFGNRVSSVLNITSKEGDSKNGKLFDKENFGKYWDLSQVHGEISLLSSKILLEGPINKGSWMWSFRRTYFDKLVDLYYLIKPPEDELDWQYYFWDTQGKLIHNFNEKHRLTFSTYLGRDVLSMEFGEPDDAVDFDWDWGNYTNSLQWRYVPNSRFLSTLSVANTNFQFDVNMVLSESDSLGNEQSSEFIIFNEINDWTIKEKFDWFISDKHTFTAGMEYKKLGMKFNFKFDDITFFKQNQKPYIFSGYLQDKWKITPLITIQSGLRISKYQLHNKLYYEPRIGLKYLVNDNLALKGAWGRYYQFLFTTNDDDAILNIVDFWQPIPKNYGAKSMQQVVIGFEQWINNGYSVTLEGYYKPYDNVLTTNPKNNPIDPDDDFVEGKGNVYGLEFLLRKNTGKLTGWIGYTYMKIEQEYDFNSDGIIQGKAGEIFSPKTDQPHTLNIVTNFSLTKRSNIGLTVSYSSGRPYTPTVGYTFTQNGGGRDTYNNPYSNLNEITGQKNSARYPDYFRTDISWTRKIKPFGWDGYFKLQIINVTNHFNVLFYNWNLDDDKVEAIGMFPFFPSIGVEFKF